MVRKTLAAQARSGEGRLLLLESEAGVGKSALREQFTSDLPDHAFCRAPATAVHAPGRSVRSGFLTAQRIRGGVHKSMQTFETDTGKVFSPN